MSAIDTARGAATNPITLSSGDNFLASPTFNIGFTGGTYYDALALQAIGYDFIGMGNHEFDFGPDVLAEVITAAPGTTWLSANADFSGEPNLQALVTSGQIAPLGTVIAGGEQIGVIGAITERLPNISSPRNVVISDVASAVNNSVAALEATGVNKFILISHLQSADEDRALIPLVPGVDIAIAGGGDELFANAGDTCAPGETPVDSYPALVGDVPLITVPGGYRCFGSLVVDFDAAGNVMSATGSSNGVDVAGPADAGVVATIETPLGAELAAIESNILATSAVALDGRKPEVRSTETNVGNLLADAQLYQAKVLAADFGVPEPVLAIQNGGGIRNDSIIPAGPFSEADTFAIAPFPNFVGVLSVPRDTLKTLLENAVSAIPDAEGRFAQIGGATMVYDPTATPLELDHDGDCSQLSTSNGERVVSLTLDDGTKIIDNGVVVPGDPVPMTIVNFSAGGGDCYPLGDLPYTTLGVTYQQALQNFVTEVLDGTISAADYPEGGEGRIAVGQVEAPTPTPTPTAPQAPAFTG